MLKGATQRQANYERMVTKKMATLQKNNVRALAWVANIGEGVLWLGRGLYTVYSHAGAVLLCGARTT